MIFADAHCDTVMRLMRENKNLCKNDCHVDLERIKKRYSNYAQFFALFVNPALGQAQTLKRTIQAIDVLNGQLDMNSGHIMLCCNYDDIMHSFSLGKIAAIISIEGGEALQGDLAILRAFYRLGVRSICLTWNYRNEIACGVLDEKSAGGLTDFGCSLLNEMNRLGMLADLSHISERSFWDVADTARAPFIVSHSNARKICSHIRNLSDDQILAVKDNGGVIGINFYQEFLSNSGKAYLTDIVRHIEHICGLAGCENIGIGSDFDGMEDVPEDIRGVEDTWKIADYLLKINYPQDAVEKIAGGNFLRVIRKVMK